MASAFYSLQEAAAKLNKTEEEVKELVKQGRLREFHSGEDEASQPLFRINEVEALMSDTSIAASKEKETSDKEGKPIEEDEISLAPESSEDLSEKGNLGGADSTAMTGEGINVLGEETDEDYRLADDTLSKTKAMSDEGLLSDDTLSETKSTSAEASLEEIEEDVNLDTFGSGSGLLDLSLQADDTSLGGILDEIYTPEGEEEEGVEKTPEASAVDVAAEAEQLMPEEEVTEPQGAAAAMVQAYAEPAPDVISNAFGIMLFLPLLAIVYTTIVAVAGFNNMLPSILTGIQSLIWYIALGVVLAAGLILGTAFILSGRAGKAKAVKKKKSKKTKKSKKAKAEAAPPPELESESELELEPEIEPESENP